MLIELETCPPIFLQLPFALSHAPLLFLTIHLSSSSLHVWQFFAPHQHSRVNPLHQNESINLSDKDDLFYGSPSSFSSSIFLHLASKASRNIIDREMEFFAINHHLLGFPLSFFCFGVNFLIFLLGFSVSVSSHLQASFKAFVGKTKAKSLSLLDLFVGSRASDNPR